MNAAQNAIVIVRNTRTGATSKLVGIWWNVFAGQWIINVRSNGYAASWFAAETMVL